MVAAVALLAGSDLLTAIRLGAAMTLLQASIGIVNDVVDAPRDVGRVPPKPIPAGLVSVRAARIAAVLAAVVGIAGAAASGVGLALLAVAVLGIGYSYDLAAKGTPWSWVPFAIGIPVLPVFGWVGAGGGPERWTVTLIVAAMVAGAALAIANARADVEVDVAAGTRSIATVLGPERSWAVATGLFAVVVALAFWTALGPGAPVRPDPPSLAGQAVAGAMLLSGALLGRRGSPVRRERAWELQAVGVAVLAASWLSVVESWPS